MRCAPRPLCLRHHCPLPPNRVPKQATGLLRAQGRSGSAKGLKSNQVVYKHALKNAISPVITLAGLQLSAIVSGAVLVETVFSWPGLGTLAFQSIIARDTPTILGILFFSSLVVIVGNQVTDLVLRLVDPRVGSKK